MLLVFILFEIYLLVYLLLLDKYVEIDPQLNCKFNSIISISIVDISQLTKSEN